MRSRIQSRTRLNSVQYHRQGEPKWWARVGQGESATYIKISPIRGDEHLHADVDLPPGTTVFLGIDNSDISETTTTIAPKAKVK